MATAIPPTQASWLSRFGPLLARLGFGESQGPAALRALGMQPPAPAAAPAVPAPAPEAPLPDMGQPAPMPGDVGPGIAIPVSDAVYATDLPPQASPFTPAPSRSVPSAMAPSSRRFSSTRPEFIYTNPAAAQQAAANYSARLGFEANQDQGYRDYLARLESERAANERANVQGQLYGNQIAAAGADRAADRASAERINLMSDAMRQYRVADQEWAENDRRAQMGEGYAATLNRDPNAKVDRRYIELDPVTGRWVSIFKRRTRPVPPSTAQAGPPVAVPQMVTAPWPGASPLPVPAVPTTPAVAARGPAAPVVVPDPGPAPMISPPETYEPSGMWSDFQPRSRQELINFITAPQAPSMSPELRRQIQALGLPQ